MSNKEIEEAAWKNLETRLHALAEEFTQGRYGRASCVDEDSLRADFDDAIDNWYSNLSAFDPEEVD